MFVFFFFSSLGTINWLLSLNTQSTGCSWPGVLTSVCYFSHSSFFIVVLSCCISITTILGLDHAFWLWQFKHFQIYYFIMNNCNGVGDSLHFSSGKKLHIGKNNWVHNITWRCDQRTWRGFNNSSYKQENSAQNMVTIVTAYLKTKVPQSILNPNQRQFIYSSHTFSSKSYCSLGKTLKTHFPALKKLFPEEESWFLKIKRLVLIKNLKTGNSFWNLEIDQQSYCS